VKNQSETLDKSASYRLPMRSLLSTAVLLAITSNVAIAETQKKSTGDATKHTAKNAEASKPSDQPTADNSQTASKQVSSETPAAGGSTKDEVMEEMVITGEVAKDSHFTSPSTRLSRAEIERQNAQTTEEAVKYQPSLQIRQRYIGDPNGVLGIRGADMFSTARNMVYADGLPLHNQLQASFNGAPRWSMVGPNEIDAVDVVYGPFSAEYSGNSIGGVVNLKTHMPMKEEYYAETSYFVQPWENIGADGGTFDGNRQYFSYGNRLDKWSALLSYNRLEAESQPMSYFIDNTGLRNPTGVTTAVNGAVPILDTRGTPSYIYGDTGPELINTDLVKLKVGYDITPDLQAIFTGAFEERTRKSEKPRNYLTSANGNAYYGDNNTNSRDAVYAGRAFNVLNSGFGPSDDERQTMQIGMQVKGAITDTWDIDTTFSYLDVITKTSAEPLFLILTIRATKTPANCKCLTISIGKTTT